MALIGAVGVSSVAVWTPDVNGQTQSDGSFIAGFPSDIQWGAIASVMPITRYSGNARVFIKLDFFTRNVYSYNITFQWKLYQVT